MGYGGEGDIGHLVDRNGVEDCSSVSGLRICDERMIVESKENPIKLIL